MYCLSYFVFSKTSVVRTPGGLEANTILYEIRLPAKDVQEKRRKSEILGNGERKDMGTQAMSLSIDKYHVKEKLDAHSH